MNVLVLVIFLSITLVSLVLDFWARIKQVQVISDLTTETKKLREAIQNLLNQNSK